MVTHLKVRAAATALTVALALPAFAQTGSSQSSPSSSGSGAQSPGMMESQSLQQGTHQGSSQRVENIEALSNAKGPVQIEGRVSDVDAAKNQFTIADDTGNIEVKLQSNANIREGDRVQVTGTVQQHTFGHNLEAERVELLNPRGGEAREKTLYNQPKQPPQQSR